MSEQRVQHYDFGPFRLSVAEGRLLRRGKAVPLTPKAFETLLKLIQSKGRVVEKEQLIREIWRDSFVEDNSLTRNISVLRKALGDEKKVGQYIETLPKRGYRFIGNVTEIFDKRTDVQKFIAVLPFKVLDEDREIKFFGLGMADSLITRLSNLRQFVVRPTRAVQKYTSGGDPVEIGSELNVEAVLDGSITRLDDHLRVTVQFISVADRKVLWGEKFDEKITNLLAVQDSIVERVANSLLSKAAFSETKTLQDYSAPQNAAAHRFFMMGRYHWNKRSKSSLQKAIENFRQAIAEDVGYAMAYVGLADSYLIAPHHHLLSPFEAFPQAKFYAESALAIDENLAEAYASLAHVKFIFDWDWTAAEQSYQQAISLKPNYSTARQWYGAFLTARGRFDEAVSELRQAQFLDPLSPSISKALGSSLAYAGRLDEAIMMYQKSLELDPNAAITYADLSIAYKWSGKIPDALAMAQKAIEVSENDPPVLTSLAECLAAFGEREKASEIAAQLIDFIESKYVSPFHLSLVFLELGDVEKTFFWLEKAVEWRDVCVPFLHINPQFKRIENERNFKSILQKANLTKSS